MTVAIVGGYRLVRRVGQGRRADVWLGHPGDDASTAPAAIKLFHSATSTASVSAEVEALARAAGPHVVTVLDFATASDGRIALVLERLGAQSLADLLTTRDAVRPGEAVTVLAPIAQAVMRMHAAGVSHGALRASAIGFSENGAPVILGFGSAVVRASPPTPASRSADAGVTDDLAALARLCRDVLEPIPGADGILEWLDAHAASPGWPADFGPRLFAWAVPEPVSMVRRDDSPSRAVAPVAVRLRPRAERGSVQRIARVLTQDWLAVAREYARTVRTRFWVVGGGVAAALVLAIALVPASSEEAPASEAAPLPTTTATLSPQDEAVRGDDPVAALEVLLDARDRCIRDLSVLCLDAVDQPGSSALARDQQLVRDLQQGAESPSVGVAREIVLEETLGGTALLTVTTANAEPASILVMRSEAGWRIRDYLDGG